jgi:hypothetical protein
MEKSEREELLRDVLDAIDEHVAACGIPEERTGYNVLAQRVTAHFADYDALEERLEGMTLSSEAAHTYAVELEAKLAEAVEDRDSYKRLARMALDVAQIKDEDERRRRQYQLTDAMEMKTHKGRDFAAREET